MTNLNQDQLKLIVGKEIASRVKEGEVVAVGTGSTVNAALLALQTRIKNESLKFSVTTTSWQSAWSCQDLGLNVLHPSFTGDISWGFDGADAVDSQLRVIKGRGGAMLMEKISAARCKDLVIIVDQSKFTEDLVAKAPIPIEVLPEAVDLVQKKLIKLGCKSSEVRPAKQKYGPVITEKGNLIIDAWFSSMHDHLEDQIKALVGVVESGLFTNFATEILIANSDGIKSLKK